MDPGHQVSTNIKPTKTQARLHRSSRRRETSLTRGRTRRPHAVPVLDILTGRAGADLTRTDGRPRLGLSDYAFLTVWVLAARRQPIRPPPKTTSHLGLSSGRATAVHTVLAGTPFLKSIRPQTGIGTQIAFYLRRHSLRSTTVILCAKGRHVLVDFQLSIASV